MSDLGEMTGLQPRVVEGRSEAVDRHSQEHPVTRYVLYKSPLTGLAPMGWTGEENSGKGSDSLGDHIHVLGLDKAEYLVLAQCAWH